MSAKMKKVQKLQSEFHCNTWVDVYTAPAFNLPPSLVLFYTGKYTKRIEELKQDVGSRLIMKFPLK